MSYCERCLDDHDVCSSCDSDGSRAEIAALRERLEKAEAFLRDLTWGEENEYNFCRVCNSNWEHTPDCELAAFLNE